MLEVNVKFQRLYNFHIASTFMPTSCILVIAEITLFISDHYFDSKIMVVLTAMLVLYTLYQSISLNLPSTSYLKMVDIWLLFGLAMLSIVFVLEVAMEILHSDHDNHIIGNIFPTQEKNSKLSKTQIWRKKLKTKLKRFINVSVPVITLLFSGIYVLVIWAETKKNE